MLTDLAHAARALWRARSTAGIAWLVLSLGIGFAVAVFSVADRVLFRPLPYPEGHRLVALRLTGLPIGSLPLSAGELGAARRLPIFEAAEAYNVGGVVTWTDGPEPQRIRLGYITPGLQAMLGAQVVAGRLLRPEDGAAGSETPVLLDYDFWRTRYGADPGVIGRIMAIDESPRFRITGILSRDFVFPSREVTFSPHVVAPVAEASMAEAGQQFDVIARLAPGLAPGAADRTVPVDVPGEGAAITARPLHESLGYAARSGLAALFAASLAVLLVAALDVAGLMLARATVRDREIATRRALGASAGRIARLLLLEGGLLAAASVCGGVLAALWLFDTMMSIVPPDLQLVQPVGLDRRALAFAGSIAAIIAVVIGLAPLLHLQARPLPAVLRGRPGAGAGHGARRAGAGLVATQIAAALVLLVIGGLLAATAWNARTIDTGIRTAGLALVSVQLPRAVHQQADELYTAAAARIRNLPGVLGVARFDAPLFESSYRPTRLRPAGRDVSRSASGVGDIEIAAAPGYFDVMGIRITQGRAFETADTSERGQPVAIVSESLAKRWWPDAPAIGQQVAFRDQVRTVIGVAGDVRHLSPKRPPSGELYIPIGAGAASASITTTFAIRTQDDRKTTGEAVAAVRSIVPGIVILSAAPAADRIARQTAAEGFHALLLSLAAAAALGLAALGAYGLLDWSVSRQRREIGIRAALGAGPKAIASGIAGQLVPPVAAGAIAGLVAAMWAARLVTSLLFGVATGSLLVWTAALVLLSIALLLAAAVPMLRAVRLPVAVALRAD